MKVGPEHFSVFCSLAIAGCLAVAAIDCRQPQPAAPAFTDAADADPDVACRVVNDVSRDKLIRNPDGTPLVAQCPGDR